MKNLIIIILLALTPSRWSLADTEASGEVTLPLEQYQRLLEASALEPGAAPSRYAIGQSKLNIQFLQRDTRVTATVQAEVQVETFVDEWTLVELLRPGAALKSATLNGQPVRLIQRANGLFWLSEQRQQVTLSLVYHVDVHYSDLAYVAGIPVPQAAASNFELSIPMQQIDLSISPASNVSQSTRGNGTFASGTLSTTPAMMVSWHLAQALPFILSRASYVGKINQDAVNWQVKFDAEMLIAAQTIVPLVSVAATLIQVRVNAEPATVFIKDGRFAVRLAGLGSHAIEMEFQSPVKIADGAPSTGFDIPRVPMSSFELDLPGNKLVQVNPSTSVRIEAKGDRTLARFAIRMSDAVALTWMEAIPADLAVELRANARIYQAVHAAEGVLYGIAAIHYEISRGQANVLTFSMPTAAQVNRIESPLAAVADWVVVDDDDADRQLIRVFLNRAVEGEVVLLIEYEQLLDEQAQDIEVPLLRALDVSRQRGMVALLSSSDLALAPTEHTEMSAVGENQLPAFFRNQLSRAVSHTYKYHSEGASLAVTAVVPERKQGKFNAQVDTLISIGEVTLKAVVSIENDVKSGVLHQLQLRLPADVNILGVSGPSIRSHAIVDNDPGQQVNIEFTRDMEGQFRIELLYERIMLDRAAEISVPRLEVIGADVEHGRIAIEALSALEVQASETEQLSSLEINELPKQLVLKTTNPILLAYKYVKTEKPFSLKLRITRHQEIEVQVAAIDQATYKTLFTRDGLAITRAQFDIRNSRRQFLRLSLPDDSRIWSVFVNGRAQKPAYATGEGDGPRDVLIKMINSASAFPVELVYATQTAPMSAFGSVSASLPRPDMIVTHSLWDVYVPPGLSYSQPQTNMELLAGPVLTSLADTETELVAGAAGNVNSGEPLHIKLPTQGLRFRFSKLYANQSADNAQFAMRYVRRDANQIGVWLSLLAVLMAWAGIVLMTRNKFRLPASVAPTLLVSAALLAALSIGLLSASVLPASILGLLIGAVLAGLAIWQRWRDTRRDAPSARQ